MKKISLKDVKNGLKRDEMRIISGGSGYNGFCGYYSFQCARLGLYCYSGNPDICCSSPGSSGSW